MFSPENSWKLKGIFSNIHFVPVLLRSFRRGFKGHFSRLSSCVCVCVCLLEWINLYWTWSNFPERNWFLIYIQLLSAYQKHSWWVLHTPEAFQRHSVTLTHCWEMLLRAVPRLPPRAASVAGPGQSALKWDLTFSKRAWATWDFFGVIPDLGYLCWVHLLW